MPPAKSRYSRPSASQIDAPSARETTSAGVETPRATYRSRACCTRSTSLRSRTDTAGATVYLSGPRGAGIDGLAAPGRRAPRPRRPARSLSTRLARRPKGGHGAVASPVRRSRAQVVVIGGGVGGCSILYWLTKLGWEDVVLVERAELTSGSTFH